MTKFHEKNYDQRLDEVTRQSPTLKDIYKENRDKSVENLTENFISTIHVPVGILRDLQVNNRHYVVPIATEEPSVVAAANKGAKMLGNIEAASQVNAMRTVQILSADPQIENYVENHTDEILMVANKAYPSMQKRGGGAKQIEIENDENGLIAVNIHIDTKNAMGANVANSMGEAVKLHLQEQGIQITGSIVTNLNDKSLVTVKAQITLPADVREKFLELADFGVFNKQRAVTENKGFLNGASGVVLATGNDWRAFEAGIHASAVIERDGYSSIVSWFKEENGEDLIGMTTIPVALGTTGGTINQQEVAKANLELMGVETSQELGEVVAATGLVQTFAAMYAIVTQGIQSGHMKLHNRAIQNK